MRGENTLCYPELSAVNLKTQSLKTVANYTCAVTVLSAGPPAIHICSGYIKKRKNEEERCHGKTPLYMNGIQSFSEIKLGHISLISVNHGVNVSNALYLLLLVLQ